MAEGFSFQVSPFDSPLTHSCHTLFIIIPSCLIKTKGYLHPVTLKMAVISWQQTREVGSHPPKRNGSAPRNGPFPKVILLLTVPLHCLLLKCKGCREHGNEHWTGIKKTGF